MLLLPRGLATAGLLGFLASQTAQATPTVGRTAAIALNATSTKSPLMDRDFADPSMLQDADGQWYAFATNGNGKNVQVARAARPEGPWTYLDHDALPSPGAWTDGRNTWAPDVQRVAAGRYVLYYAGELAANPAHHCIGAATASSVVGPFTPVGGGTAPWECHPEAGGAIDAAGFLDAATGRRYVVYKVDGNSIGHGGSCGNGVPPLAATPIMLQEVAAGDGVTRVGAAVQILDRTAQDGPLVEAPSLVRAPDGRHVLFFSTHCYDSPAYDVEYAVSAGGVAGPYVRGPAPLLRTGDVGLTAPGVATAVETGAGAGAGAGGRLVFHANCPQGRCLFEAAYEVRGGSVVVVV